MATAVSRGDGVQTTEEMTRLVAQCRASLEPHVRHFDSDELSAAWVQLQKLVAELSYTKAPSQAEFVLSHQASIAMAAHPPAVLSMLSQRKLALVLDLDHTLLNSTPIGMDMSEEDARYMHDRVAAEAHLPPEKRDVFFLPQQQLWTKLRPGVRAFLAAAAAKFSLVVYTNATPDYAHAVVRLLDPDGCLFGDRIIAQGVPGQSEIAAVMIEKSMGGILNGMEPFTIVVDDSVSAWPKHQHNMVFVERYHFFPHSRKVHGLDGISLLEARRDESPVNGMLEAVASVLDHVHDGVFAALERDAFGTKHGFPCWDARVVLFDLAHSILQGAHIVFSHVIPIDIEPSQHALWQLAERLGATCEATCDDATTHVVSRSLNTDKALWAKQRGIPIVSPMWLEACGVLWRRVEEAPFALTQ